MRLPLLSTLPLLALAAGVAAAPPPGRVTATRAPVARPALPAGSPMFQVATGRGRLVTLPRPMSDVFIADGGVADVQARSPTQLYIFGKKTGETTISVTNKAGQVVFAATVRVGTNYDSIGQMLGLAMPEARIVATPMNGLVLLTGTVDQPADAAEAERLVQAYVGDGTKVLSRLKTATPLQVMLQVRIAEVSRNFSKNVNSNLQTYDGTGGFKFGVARGTTASQYAPLAGPATNSGLFVGGSASASANSTAVPSSAGSSTLGLAGHLLGLDILNTLNLGETIGQVATLANPNLTCLSGETCNFLVGGEIPIPISQGLGAVSVEYKSYGISLSYAPTVLSDGRISIRVRPEVSQLTSAGAVQLNGTTIPAIATRRADTTLELGSGQSMVIGGLLQNTHNNTIEKTPGLGDVPILGTLFRSNGWTRGETELMIVITPYLVKPVNSPGDIVLPTDGEQAPTDFQRVFLGELGTGKSGAKRPVPTVAAPTAPAPTIGALSPVPVAPAPTPAADPRRAAAVADDRVVRAVVKAPAPTPGFSN